MKRKGITVFVGVEPEGYEVYPKRWIKLKQWPLIIDVHVQFFVVPKTRDHPERNGYRVWLAGRTDYFEVDIGDYHVKYQDLERAILAQVTDKEHLFVHVY